MISVELLRPVDCHVLLLRFLKVQTKASLAVSCENVEQDCYVETVGYSAHLVMYLKNSSIHLVFLRKGNLKIR
ncbi:hypothetical protein IGI04_037186 [Brassica rapa subsp. trilocularis]|uniref:Uncharacterized protein n=1 Tax=Brassica rapa subsp. trilocularis TaxID=1813537 RepID=A0ABQ7LKG5_BRACM|nr:hypothetical protein IGI04_037186 [Brassica rapa subsp. trilocularis]